MTQGKDIKIIFWGTPEFSIPSLEALIKADYNVVAVVTNPDELVGRKQILTPPPVKVLAEKYKIPVYQPEVLKNNEIFLKEFREIAPNLCIVAAYGKIIPKEILDIPSLGFLNIHPSLLPRWRGPSPIQYTILNGDTETGVTIIKMDERMDRGPIIAKSKIQISKSKITYRELHNQLAKLGAELLIKTLPQYLGGAITSVSQDDSKATYSKILKKDDGRIDWEKTAEEIERMIRAFTPWPGAWTVWPTVEKSSRVRIEKADTIESDSREGVPGRVWRDEAHPLLIQTKKGSIAVTELTLEGKRRLGADEFLKGHPSFIGATLI